MSNQIEVITGGMFSGKSAELIRRLRRAEYAKLDVIAFKPEVDDRYSKDHIMSHHKSDYPSVRVNTSTDIRRAVEAKLYDVVGIDEGQFFDDKLPDVVRTLSQMGVKVIIAGLDLDSHLRPFGVMPKLMAIADSVDKLHAVCVVCGEEASYTYHKGQKIEQVKIGAEDAYEARCKCCYFGFTRNPLTLTDWVDAAYQTAKSKGWWENKDPAFGDFVSLTMTELAEAFEEYRKGKKVDEVYIKDGKPEGIPIELADCVIRIFNYCGGMGIDLESAIRQKHHFNKSRPYRHGGKKL